jgi:type IV secretion system protein VirD4
MKTEYDITKHPLYRYTSDFDKRNAFDIERFLSCRLKVKPDERYQVKKVDLSDKAPAAE